MWKTITVCMGSSCFARGNSQILTFIESYIKENNLATKIDLIGSSCEGRCTTGPNIKIGSTTYRSVRVDFLENILNNEFGVFIEEFGE